MSLGKVTMTTRSGGRQTRANGARVAKSICVLAVSPKGTPNTLIRISSQSALARALDTGKGADIAALTGADYLVPLTPSTAGALGAVTKTGSGTATIVPSLATHKLIEILISTAGILGTSKFRYRVGGTGAWSEEIATVASYRVPGTFTTLAFAAGTYVLNSTYTISTAGAITLGGSAINTVTQVSSPLDDYDFTVTVKKAGALGTAVLSVSPDGGNSTFPDLLTPAAGVIVVPNTGVVLTCSGTFVVDEVYSFLAIAPGYSTSDVSAAITAAKADKTASFAIVLVPGMPSSAANAISLAATVNTAIESAETSDGVQWQALTDCPLVGDTILSGGVAVADTLDTSSALRTAREGQDLKHTAVCYSTTRYTSPLTGFKLKRGRSVGFAGRINETEPRIDPSDRSLGPLANVFAMGVDAADYVELDDAQFNGLQAERHLGEGAFIAITSGGYGIKHMTTDADYQDAAGVRALNCALRSLRPVLEALKGSRPPANADGTIEETSRKAFSTLADRGIKRGVGLATGGDFAEAQASSATAEILATSQVGDSPHKLDAEYSVQKLGFVSDVDATGTYSGVLSV